MGTAQGLQSLASLTGTSCGVTNLSLEAVGKDCTNSKSMCLRECFVSDNSKGNTQRVFRIYVCECEWTEG